MFCCFFLSPKSVVASGTGLFAAQNMVYRHTITLYNKQGKLLETINDVVNLKQHGFEEYQNENYKGGPVEAVFSHAGKYLWVTQYQMYGSGFSKPGCDACNGSQYDPGFLYKINTENHSIESVIKVGSVPKFLAISEDEKLLIVSNWSSGDVSLVDVEAEKEIKRIKIGAHPRGVDISKDKRKAYVTVMGSTRIAVIDLQSYEVNYISGIGKSPRHLVLSSDDSLLYVAVNSSNTVVKYNLNSNTKEVCCTRSGPRTMVLSPHEDFLYVVNYFGDTFTKIRTDSMKIVEEVATDSKPIGITANWEDAEIWVACYSGKIEIFKDFDLEMRHGNSSDFPGSELLANLEFGIINKYINDLYTINNIDSFKSLNEVSKTKDRLESDGLIAKNYTNATDSSPVGMNQQRDRQNETTNDIVENREEPIVNATKERDYFGQMSTDAIVAENGIAPRLAKVGSSVTKVKALAHNEENCHYHVIVGSFSVPENAENLRKELSAKGYAVQLIPGKTLTYVSARCFADREKAKRAMLQIQEDLGGSAWVLKN